MDNRPHIRIKILSHVSFAFAMIASLLMQPAEAKLLSTSVQQDRARRVIEDIFRETKLNEDSRFWGDRNKVEIDQYTKLLGMNYYQVFLDMGINGAMARCGVSAKYEGDYQRWLREMDRFDRAAEELNVKDKARYYFAKGLLVLQFVPSRVQTLPDAFYKAAENGFPSAYIADHLSADANSPAAKGRTDLIAETLVKLAESYRRGGFAYEAYKFYLLSLKAGKVSPETLVRMAECARSAGNDQLAYATGLMFLDAFSAYDGASRANTAGLTRLDIAPGASAEDVATAAAQYPWDANVRVPADSAIAVRQDGASALRAFNSFDGRYVQPLTKAMGTREDLFKIAAALRYWNDTTAVKRFVPRVNGAIGSQAGEVDSIARLVRDDPRFSNDPELAKWEFRRWKAANRGEEFARQFPHRYKLTGGE